MFNHSIKLDQDDIRVRNGHCVMNAIASQNNQITEDELLDQFITSTDASRDLIEQELKQILYNGVVGGFIVKTGNIYAIPTRTLENTYATDCDDGDDGDDDEDDDNKDDVKEGDATKYAITISSPDRPDVTVKVEPGTSRKRAATDPSSHEFCPKRGRDTPCAEALALTVKLDAFKEATKKVDLYKTARIPKHEPKLKEIDEDEEEDEEDEEEAEEDESGPGLKGERKDDDDDPSGCKTGPAEPRRSTRKIIPAKGKCGGRSDPHGCKY